MRYWASAWWGVTPSTESCRNRKMVRSGKASASRTSTVLVRTHATMAGNFSICQTGNASRECNSATRCQAVLSKYPEFLDLWEKSVHGYSLPLAATSCTRDGDECHGVLIIVAEWQVEDRPFALASEGRVAPQAHHTPSSERREDFSHLTREEHMIMELKLRIRRAEIDGKVPPYIRQDLMGCPCLALGSPPADISAESCESGVVSAWHGHGQQGIWVVRPGSRTCGQRNTARAFRIALGGKKPARGLERAGWDLQTQGLREIWSCGGSRYRQAQELVRLWHEWRLVLARSVLLRVTYCISPSVERSEACCLWTQRKLYDILEQGKKRDKANGDYMGRTHLDQVARGECPMAVKEAG